MAVPTPNPLSLAPTALKAVQDFRARNEVRVLFGLLKKELAGRPDFPWKQVERLALDPSTRGFLLNLIDDGRVDQQALRGRLVALCDPGAYGASREELADEVLAAILEKAPLAVRSDREATRNIVRGEIDPLYALIADLLGGPDPQDALRAPYLDLPEEIADGNGPPSLPLRAEYGVVPFRGREDELTRIEDWCAEEALVSVAVIVAGPGAGKTRLAAQAAEALQQAHGWVTGMLKPDLDGAMVDALATLDLPQLVVIDGAPSRGPEIAELLKALGRAERSTPVRLLLLARDDGEWREKELPRLLHGSGGPEIVFGSTRVWPLGSAAADLDARAETFHDAAIAFAEVFALSPETVVEPDLTQELFAEILCVHLAALTSVAGDPEVLRGRVAADDLLEDLLAREAGYWDACPRPVGLAIDDPDVRARVVALATMTYADDEEQAAATLRAIPDLADASERERRAIARWLKKLYPASRRPTADGAPQEQWFRPLRPDLIGEYLVADALMPVPELAVRLTAAATPDQLERALTVLTRSARFHQPAEDALLAALEANLGAIWEACLKVAVQTGEPMGRLLAEALRRSPDPELAMTMVAAIPRETTALREAAVVVAEQALAWLNHQAPAAQSDIQLAYLTDELSIRLSAVGRRQDALDTVQASVAIRRRLATADPDTFLPDLAGTLNNESNELSAVGRHEEALTAVKDAATIYRGLAEQHPDKFLPNLATVRNNESSELSAIGRREEALTAIQEAATIYRGLAEQHPDKFLPDLAMARNNESSDLSALGRREEALTASQEAATIYRGLAEQHPDAFLPNLATARNNESNRLAALGRHEEAHTSIQEAVAIYRGLAEQHPDAFLPNFASARNNESNRLATLGRHEEALAAIQEAVAVRRHLAEQHPEAFLPDLATARHNEAGELAALGQHEEALAAIREAISLVLPMLERQPFALPDSGRMLGLTYLHLCGETDTTPDPELVHRLVEVLEKVGVQPD